MIAFLTAEEKVMPDEPLELRDEDEEDDDLHATEAEEAPDTPDACDGLVRVA